MTKKEDKFVKVRGAEELSLRPGMKRSPEDALNKLKKMVQAQPGSLDLSMPPKMSRAEQDEAYLGPLTRFPRSSLAVSAHAVQRFYQRGHFKVNRMKVFTFVLQMLLVHKSTRIERVLDGSVGDALTLLYFLPSGEEAFQLEPGANLTHASDGAQEMFERLQSFPAMVAVVRGDTVVTILTMEQVQHNKDVGQYKDSEKKKPLTLTQKLPLENVMPTKADPRAVSNWAREYIKDNPNASLHTIFKAANNSRVAPLKEVINHVYAEEQAKREAAKAAWLPPPEPECTRTDAEVDECECGLGEGCKNTLVLARIARGAPPFKPTPPVVGWVPPKGAPPPEPSAFKNPAPTAPAPVVATGSTGSDSGLTEASRRILAVMREFNLSSVIMTVTDRDGEKPKVSWEAEVKVVKALTGEVEL